MVHRAASAMSVIAHSVMNNDSDVMYDMREATWTQWHMIPKIQRTVLNLPYI
jgi:hypothetical protein